MMAKARRSLPAALLAALVLAVPAAADTPITTVRPTGVGLPEIGVQSGISAGDTPAIVAALRQYHHSGRYRRDLAKVSRLARRSLASQLATLAPHTKPAIVLDIDETSLSNWASLSAGDFGAKPVPDAIYNAPDPAIGATLAIYRSARAHHVAVFFITGRGPDQRAATERNLRSVGYRSFVHAYFHSGGKPVIAYKSGRRALIERHGYTILVNVGDQMSDLRGGHAQQAFKYPNPFYFIG